MKKIAIIAGSLAVLFASQALAAEPTTINLCTGGEGKPYHATGQYIAGFLKDSKNVRINVLVTDGTWDNIERTALTAQNEQTIASGESCQAFIGQPDGAVVLKRTNPAAISKIRKIGKGPVEYLQVLCGKDSGIENLSDLAGDNSKSVALGSAGSGAWLIWENFKNENSSYSEVQVTDDSGVSAIAAVANGTTTCAIIPAALRSSDMMQADEDFGDSLVLVGATDKDFNDALDIDGKPLYSWHEIPSQTYEKNLQNGWFNSVETIAWESGIYVNTDAFRNNKKALNDLITAIAKAKPAIKNTYGSLE